MLGVEGYMLRGKGRDEVVRMIEAFLHPDLHLILASSILLGGLFQCLWLTVMSRDQPAHLQLSILQELISRSGVNQDVKRALGCFRSR